MNLTDNLFRFSFEQRVFGHVQQHVNRHVELAARLVYALFLQQRFAFLEMPLTLAERLPGKRQQRGAALRRLRRRNLRLDLLNVDSGGVRGRLDRPKLKRGQWRGRAIGAAQDKRRGQSERECQQNGLVGLRHSVFRMNFRLQNRSYDSIRTRP